MSLRDRLYSCLLTVQALYTVFVKTSVVCKHPGWCSLLVRKLCPQFVRIAEVIQYMYFEHGNAFKLHLT